MFSNSGNRELIYSQLSKICLRSQLAFTDSCRNRGGQPETLTCQKVKNYTLFLQIHTLNLNYSFTLQNSNIFFILYCLKPNKNYLFHHTYPWWPNNHSCPSGECHIFIIFKAPAYCTITHSLLPFFKFFQQAKITRYFNQRKWNNVINTAPIKEKVTTSLLLYVTHWQLLNVFSKSSKYCLHKFIQHSNCSEATNCFTGG